MYEARVFIIIIPHVNNDCTTREQELEEERRLASAVGRLEGEVRAAGRAREEVHRTPTPLHPNPASVCDRCAQASASEEVGGGFEPTP